MDDSKILIGHKGWVKCEQIGFQLEVTTKK